LCIPRDGGKSLKSINRPENNLPIWGKKRKYCQLRRGGESSHRSILNKDHTYPEGKEGGKKCRES